MVARCWHFQVTKVKFEILSNDIDQVIVSLLSEFSKLHLFYYGIKKYPSEHLFLLTFWKCSSHFGVFMQHLFQNLHIM